MALGTSLLPEGSDFGGVLHVHHALSSDLDVDPEAKRVLGVALEKTRVSLGLADDFANGIIAKRIVELAKAGERNPDLLCEGAIEQLREHLYGTDGGDRTSAPARHGHATGRVCTGFGRLSRRSVIPVCGCRGDVELDHSRPEPSGYYLRRCGFFAAA